MADIFISYAREDRQTVAQLAVELERAGYSLWWDRNIAAGSRYLRETEAELKAAKVVLVVWTQSSIDSHWVADEAGAGRDTGRLVPISADGSQPPLGFRQFQVIDFTAWPHANGPLGDLLSGLARFGAPGAPSHAAIAAPARDQTKSIAVLPFADMSPGRDQEYFADGLAEALLNLLARNRELRVAARTSSFAFKGLGRTIAEIARELGVAMVLEGSVRKAADKVRITAQLIDAHTGFHIWSETFTRQLTDVFEVQDEISEAIASKLQATMGGAAPSVKSRTQNPQAYEAFLEGDFHFGKGETSSWKQAQTFYQRAIDLDPGFAPAYARAAWAILKEIDPTQEDYARARKFIDRALQLQPDLPDALYALGLWNFTLGAMGPHDEAIERLSRAAPDSPLTAMGRVRMLALRLEYAAALPYMEHLAAIDPLGAEANVVLGLVMGNQDRSEEAIVRIRHAIPYNPQSIELRAVLATEQMLAGDQIAAANSFIETLRLAPNDNRCRNWLSFMLGSSGFTQEAAAFTISSNLRANYSGAMLLPGAQSNIETLRPIAKGYYYWRRGDLTAAKQYFEEAYASGPQAPAFALSSPGMFKTALLAARKRAGETAAAEFLAREIADDIRRGEANGWSGSSYLTYKMTYAAVMGDAHGFADIGLNAKRAHLEVAVRTTHDVAFDDIRGTPEFDAVQKRLSDFWAARRADFLASGVIDRVRILIADMSAS